MDNYKGDYMDFDKRLQSIFNCNNCRKKTCSFGCPLNNNIYDAIKEIKKENYKKAFEYFEEKTVLMPICGRICPHERQCEGTCVKKNSKKKVRIGKIEAYLGDLGLKNNWKKKYPEKNNYRVAIVGGGPAGLTCASFLRRNGINVTIYEKHDYLGGLLIHGIPEFRLPKDIVNSTINNIIDNEIDVIYNQELGRNLKLNDLCNNYDAVFIGIGANISNKLHIKGENKCGVYGANEVLEKKIDIDYKDKEVIVIGGGDVAMDISRTIIRKNPKSVTIIYRGEEKNIPANKREVNSSKREGIKFLYNTNVININGKDSIESVTTINTSTSIDDLGKKIVSIIEGTESIVKADIVVKAVGSHTDKVVKNFNLELTDNYRIKVDRNGHTSNEKVFAGGDVIPIKNTVAWASRSGRNAAYEIMNYLENK